METVIIENLNRGVMLAQEGRLDKALTAFEEALSFDPANVNALFHKARVLGRLGRFQKASLIS